MRMLLVPILLTTLMSACAPAASKLPAPACPQLVEYTPQTQLAAEMELKQLRADGPIRSRMMPDYGRMREETRACQRTGT